MITEQALPSGATILWREADPERMAAARAADDYARAHPVVERPSIYPVYTSEMAAAGWCSGCCLPPDRCVHVRQTASRAQEAERLHARSERDIELLRLEAGYREHRRARALRDAPIEEAMAALTSGEIDYAEAERRIRTAFPTARAVEAYRWATGSSPFYELTAWKVDQDITARTKDQPE